MSRSQGGLEETPEPDSRDSAKCPVVWHSYAAFVGASCSPCPAALPTCGVHRGRIRTTTDCTRSPPGPAHRGNACADTPHIALHVAAPCRSVNVVAQPVRSEARERGGELLLTIGDQTITRLPDCAVTARLVLMPALLFRLNKAFSTTCSRRYTEHPADGRKSSV
jgi:hypothetical protein